MMGVADGDGFLPVHKASMQESTKPLTILLQENVAHASKSEHLICSIIKPFNHMYCLLM